MTPELEYLESLQGSGIRPGLGRMRAVLRAAGNPHRAVPAVIIAGTNGKGSTSATLASIFGAAGYRGGLYTSPHLVRLNERWRIGGEDVGDASLAAAIRAMKEAADRASIVPTYFEALTLLAFLLFRDARCEVAVLEVGMGGRLDATNVVRPLAALITPIGFDHTEYLGTTLRAIAREKAGVIHRGAIVLSSAEDPVVRRVVGRRAASFGAAVHWVTEETSIRKVTAAGAGQSFEFETPSDRYALSTPLAGAHQTGNVALAVRGAEELRVRFPRIDRNAIIEGVARTRWAGRLDRREYRGREMWLDGAHNAHAMERLRLFVDSLSRPRTLVCAMMRDKDVADALRTIVPLFDRCIFTKVDEQRGADPADLAAAARHPRAETADSAGAALDLALRDEGVIVATGSLYLVGALIELIEGEGGRQ